MVGGAEIPQTRTSSRVRSTEEMDSAINDLTSKFASMSTVLEEIRSAIVGGVMEEISSDSYSDTSFESSLRHSSSGHSISDSPYDLPNTISVRPSRKRR
ncbi:hypothetical protein Tco_1287927, partial [Tanacetum coccineum]